MNRSGQLPLPDPRPGTVRRGVDAPGKAEGPAGRKKVSILLVDDHVLVREGLKEILATEEHFDVVGEAADSESTLDSVIALRPDIVLLDVEIPGSNVTTTVRRIRTASPETGIVILSMHEGPQLVQSLLALGIRGYLHKSVSRLGLIAAISAAADNDDHIVVSVSPGSIVSQRSDIIDLSERERAVLQLVAYAMSNAQIGRKLSLSEATVKRHLRNIFVKLDAVSRIDAVNKAVEVALIEPPRPAL